MLKTIIKLLIPALTGALLFVAGFTVTASAQSDDGLPPMSQYQAMLDHGKKSGWIAFANHGKRQFIYFSHLQTLHCRLKEIRYSINSTDLDKRFGLVKCIPQLPFSLPSKPKISDTVLMLPLGTAQSVAVQVVWKDGRESDVAIYKPCEGVGDRTCTQLVK